MNLSSVALQGAVRRVRRQSLRRGLAGVAGGDRGSGKGLTNALIAGTLLTFVGGIYWTAMSKMKQKDELAEIIEANEAKDRS